MTTQINHSEGFSIQVADYTQPSMSVTVDGDRMFMDTGLQESTTNPFRQEQTAGILDTVRTQDGSAVALSEVSPYDLVSIDGLEISVREAEQHGFLVRDERTGKYRDPSVTYQANQEYNQSSPENNSNNNNTITTNNKEAGKPSEATEEKLGNLIDRTPVELLNTITNNVLNRDVVMYEDATKLGQALGVDSFEAERLVKSIKQDFEESIKSAVASNGVSDYKDFSDWCKYSPEAKEALNDFLKTRDVKKFMDVSERYLDELIDDNKETLLKSTEVSAQELPNGEIVVDVPGKGNMNLKQAVKLGLVRLG